MGNFLIKKQGIVVAKIPQKMVSKKPLIYRNPTNKQITAYLRKHHPDMVEGYRARVAAVNNLPDRIYNNGE